MRMDSGLESTTMESRLQWSRTRYSLRDFISSSQRMDTLPAVVRVADGYIGDDDDDRTHSVTEGTVFFVYSVDEQPRVIAQTEDGRFISFSRKCTLLFHVILNDQSHGRASLLDEIVERERNNIGDLRIRMSDPGEGGLGPKDAGYEDIRGVLRVLDLFDEKYLLCHPLCGDRFRCVEVVSIPSYLPLSVNVARGWKVATNSDFREFLNDVRASGHVVQGRYSEQPTRNSEEIVVFSDLPNGDYELIIPSSSSSPSPSLEMSRIPSFKVFDKKKPKSSPDDSSGSEVVVSPPPSSSTSSRPSLPPRKLSGGWTSMENPKGTTTTTAALHLARRPLPPVPDEKPETGSGPNEIRTKEEEEEEEAKKKTKTMERKEKKSAKNKKKNFFAFMKDTGGRYSPHKSSDEATEVRDNNPEEKEEKGLVEARKGPRSYVRKRPNGVDKKLIPEERRVEMIRFASGLTVDGDCGQEVIWTGSRDKRAGSDDRPTLGCFGVNSSSSSLTSLQEQRCPRPLVTFSRNISANSAAAATEATDGGGRVKPPVPKKPTSSSSSCLSSSTTTTTPTAKTEGTTEVHPSGTSSSSSLAKKVSTGKLPEVDLGDSGMFSSSVEPLPSIQSSCGEGGGGGGGDVEEYESFYDVIQSPRGKEPSSDPDDDDEEEEEGSSGGGGGGVYPETPDADIRWNPLRYPQKKKQRRRTEKAPDSDDDDDDGGDMDSSSYEEISSPPLLLLHPPRTSSSPSTITPHSSSLFSAFQVPSFPGDSRRESSERPDSTACDLMMISLHEEETAPRAPLPPPPPPPHLSSAPHQHLWASIDEVPADIASLSVEQVSACLNVLNLGQYVRSFREHQIDGALLACLDREVLVGDFRFRSFEAIKLVKFARDGWRPRIKENETNA